MKTAIFLIVSVLAITVAFGGPQAILDPALVKVRLEERAKAARQSAALTVYTNEIANAKSLGDVQTATVKWATAEKAEKEKEAKPTTAASVAMEPR
jgi:hypothetical protein